MGLVMTGTDYFVAGGQVRETNILTSTRKLKKTQPSQRGESNGAAEHARRRSDRAGNPSEGSRQGLFNVRRQQIMHNRVVLATARCSVTARPKDNGDDDDCIHRSVDKPNE